MNTVLLDTPEQEAQALLVEARRAMALYDLEGWEEAVALLREALDLSPAQAAARAALAECYAYWGLRREISGQRPDDDYAMAMTEAKKALELGPDRADCHRAMALALRRGEWANMDRRREEALAALDLDPKDPDTWHEYWRVRGYDPDDPCAAKVLELEPRHCGMLIDLGAALHERGRPQEAAARLTAALDANPRNALARYDLAMVLASVGHVRQAKQLLRESLELHPGDPLLEGGLAFLEET